MSSLIPEPSAVSRRRFLQLMGASAALASASGCHWDTEEILPFQRRPEGRIPGTTRRFATALECSGVAASLLVTSYDGRPIKIEGNPLHPLERGAASARSQAALLDLYDPDHSRGLVQASEGASYPRSWKEFDPWFEARMAAARAKQGAGLWILAEPSSSLALAALRTRFELACPAARWVEWEPCARANEIEGAKLAYGRALRVQPRLERVNTLVCLDADLLGEHPAALAHARAWAARRDPAQEHVLRLWSVESSLSLTGAAADQRLALRHEQILPFALGLAGGPNTFGPFLERLAAELLEQRGTSLVVAGPRQPAAVHALVHRLNATLGNVGKTLVYTEEREPARGESLADLVREMNAGKVETLLVLGGNPAYDAPVELEFARALRKVPLALHLSHYRDETSRASTWHLPRAHALESWGDAASWDGTRCLQQPLIEPIFPRRTPLELLAAVCGAKESAAELVRVAVAPGASEAQWKRMLHDGFVEGSAAAPVEPALANFTLPAPAARALRSELSNGELELVFAPDRKLYDGRSANNSWLQETPDALTKMTWGNAACFAAETAAALGVEDATLVTLQLGARELEVAAVIVPGQAPGSVTLHLGYGRRAAGLVGGQEQEGIETVGFDAYRLRSSDALDRAVGLTVRPSGKSWPLARTTDPAVSDSIGRKQMEGLVEELVREVKLERYRKEPGGQEREQHESLWQKAAPGAVRWGMAIDLNSCIGCDACVVACQAENNMPVVGSEQVIARPRDALDPHRPLLQRRSERAPHVRFQPLHLPAVRERAVRAGLPGRGHDAQRRGPERHGLQPLHRHALLRQQLPVQGAALQLLQLPQGGRGRGHRGAAHGLQPRGDGAHRGVMEKCTFCVQRIQAAKIDAKNEGRAMADGEIVTACQQTCPTQAIVFGDLDGSEEPASRAARPRRAATRCSPSSTLGPRTTYLAKVTNPNPELEEA